jgi:hypothetical protein
MKRFFKWLSNAIKTLLGCCLYMGIGLVGFSLLIWFFGLNHPNQDELDRLSRQVSALEETANNNANTTSEIHSVVDRIEGKLRQ